MIDPGTLGSVGIIVTSAGLGLLARRGIAALDARRARPVRRTQPVRSIEVSPRPLVRPVAPAVRR